MFKSTFFIVVSLVLSVFALAVSLFLYSTLPRNATVIYTVEKTATSSAEVATVETEPSVTTTPTKTITVSPTRKVTPPVTAVPTE